MASVSSVRVQSHHRSKPKIYGFGFQLISVLYFFPKIAVFFGFRLDFVIVFKKLGYFQLNLVIFVKFGSVILVNFWNSRYYFSENQTHQN